MKLSSLLLRPCDDADALHAWVHLFTGMNVPRAGVCPGHDAPFAYLEAAYFEPARDLVVWAPRGGGKTRLAAVATLLDLLHKPGCRVRILGGSLAQSMKMWDYLLPDLHRLARRELTNRLSDSSKRLRLRSGSDAAVLTQSQRAVRGLRVQKLRCDEVELFDPEVWEAAQLVTRSTTLRGGRRIAGSVEALSTLHRPHGLMSRVVESAERNDVRIIKWCLLDVLERCGPERECETCPLFDECNGRAKTHAGGHFAIDDAIRMKRRVSLETWESEMLCRRPSTRGRVFPHFEAQAHVRTWEGRAERTVLGVDFGFSNPFVALWIAVGPGGRLWVFDEHVQERWTTQQHAAFLAKKPWPKPEVIFCDPAGSARNAQTAASDVEVLRRAGYAVRHRPSRIVDGLELIRQALRPATGKPRLLVDPRCTKLIHALEAYHYPETGGELPLKDGVHDHPIDALRYALLGLERPERVKVGRY